MRMAVPPCGTAWKTPWNTGKREDSIRADMADRIISISMKVKAL